MSQKIVQMDLSETSNKQKREDVLFDAYISSKMRKKFQDQELLNQNQKQINESLKVCISFLMHDMDVLEAMVQRQQNTIDRLCQDSVKKKDSELLHSEPKNPLGEKETSP